MKTITSTPMLWTEMTDDLSEAVNGGKHGCNQSYYYCEKPKEKKCEPYVEPTYYHEEKQYNKCDSSMSKWW